ncbi:HAD family hydrolase [Dyella psychrodurans]|uniref:phosphoglycolate phosphatase n=1 Tax=Dyella psychrodurans TaxID=1927960 RepID=A0A370X2I3_9GAMM|nr:HAD family hydrolase [Dyella psychrodurans]RDS82609.1 HAD family hydrolase [Dyella psychrodurans]
MRQLLLDAQHIVFDWNGTLIDDVDLAVRAVNRCCNLYGLNAISRDEYRSKFRFPIRDFYRDLGFQVENRLFDDVIKNYLSVFDRNVFQCALYEGTVALLEKLLDEGKILSILSASHQSILTETVGTKGLERYFTYVVGLGDNHARGKLGIARELQDRSGVATHRTLYIGDTNHDAEVATSMGWSFLMVRSGHQTRSDKGNEAVDSLREILVRLQESEHPGAPGQRTGGFAP